MGRAYYGRVIKIAILKYRFRSCLGLRTSVFGLLAFAADCGLRTSDFSKKNPAEAGNLTISMALYIMEGAPGAGSH